MSLPVKRAARYLFRKSVHLANVIHERFVDEVEGDYQRVVIFCPYSGVGNLLLWIPALKALHRAYSGVEVFLVGPTENTALLLLEAGLVKRSLPFAFTADASFLKQVDFIIKNVRTLKPDAALCTFLEPPRRASLWVLLSGAAVRVGYGEKDEGILFTKRLPPSPDVHEVYRNYKLVELLGVSGEMPSFEYTPSEANLEWGEEWLRQRKVPSPRIGIHPGSAGGRRQERKRWRVENFIEVAKRFTAEGMGVVVFEGPFEGDVGALMEQEVKENIFVVRGEKLNKIAGLMKQLDVIVANDSGLMHLAASLKVPLVALFGPTDFKKNYPLCDDSIVIRKHCPHAPCYLLERAPCGENINCMNEITTLEVVSGVFDLLDKRKK